jgi:putative PIN family toxin of toxin-antitoxin system
LRPVVADTNILISTLMFRGPPDILLRLALEGRTPIATSRALLDELEKTPVAKFAVTEADARAARLRLEGIAEIVAPEMALHVIRDDPDRDRVLERGVAGRPSSS